MEEGDPGDLEQKTEETTGVRMQQLSVDGTFQNPATMRTIMTDKGFIVNAKVCKGTEKKPSTT